MMTKAELFNTPIGSMVESATGTVYRLLAVTRTHVELGRVPPGQWRDIAATSMGVPPAAIERITVSQALRLLVVAA